MNAFASNDGVTAVLPENRLKSCSLYCIVIFGITHIEAPFSFTSFIVIADLASSIFASELLSYHQPKVAGLEIATNLALFIVFYHNAHRSPPQFSQVASSLQIASSIFAGEFYHTTNPKLLALKVQARLTCSLNWK